MIRKKRIVSLVLLVLCGSTSAFSQNIDLEVQSGLIASIFKGDTGSALPGFGSVTRRISINGGILVGAALNDYLVIKTGLGYSQRGAVYETDSFMPFYGSEEYVIKMNYLELPFLVFVGPEILSVFAGPQFSFPIKTDFSSKHNEFGLQYGIACDMHRFINLRIQLYKSFTNLTGSSEVVLKNKYADIVVGFKILKMNSRSRQSKTDIPHRTLD